MLNCCAEGAQFNNVKATIAFQMLGVVSEFLYFFWKDQTTKTESMICCLSSFPSVVTAHIPNQPTLQT